MLIPNLEDKNLKSKSFNCEKLNNLLKTYEIFPDC